MTQGKGQVPDSLLNIVLHQEARATPEEVRLMAAELQGLRASNGQAPAGAALYPGCSHWGMRDTPATAQAAPAAGAVAGPGDEGLIALVRTFLVREDECRERENDDEDRFTDLERTQYRILRASAVQALRKALAAAPTPAAQADSQPAPATWLTDPAPTPEREFAEWLNERRGFPVSAVFHEIMHKFAARAQADSVLEDARKENICIDCTNADSWGLPDKSCCQSCVASSNWQPLNRSSVNPNAARKQGGTQ